MIISSVLAACIAFCGNADAQQNTRLSPAQQQTVQQLVDELRGVNFTDACGIDIRFLTESGGRNIDPILVGRNLVFCQDWLARLRDRSITGPQFRRFRDTLDDVYDAFADFLGRPPRRGEKIFVNVNKDISRRSDRTTTTRTEGHAHPAYNVICVPPHTRLWINVIRSNDIMPFTEIHEIAHTFSVQAPRHWVAETETVANWLTSYAVEKLDFRLCYNPSMRTSISFFDGRLTDARIDHPDLQIFRGTQYRAFEFNKAHANFRRGVHTMPKWAKASYEDGSAYAYIMFGLPNRVGWEAIAQAVRSYNDSNFVQTRSFQGDRQNVMVHNFLYRVAHFSNRKDDLLWQDAVIVVNHHFPVTVQ